MQEWTDSPAISTFKIDLSHFGLSTPFQQDSYHEKEEEPIKSKLKEEEKHKLNSLYNQLDRNMISNSLKVFRKYAMDSSKKDYFLVQKIIDLRKLSYSIEEFKNDIKLKMEKERNYLGIKFLDSLLSSKDSNFSIVFRILALNYYKKEVYPTILTNYKILSKAKFKQLVSARKICADSLE